MIQSARQNIPLALYGTNPMENLHGPKKSTATVTMKICPGERLSVNIAGQAAGGSL